MYEIRSEYMPPMFRHLGGKVWLLDNGCVVVVEQEHIISGLTMEDDDLGMLDRGLGHLGERSFMSSPESPAFTSHSSLPSPPSLLSQ